jgi:hypothetical protein
MQIKSEWVFLGNKEYKNYNNKTNLHKLLRESGDIILNGKRT